MAMLARSLLIGRPEVTTQSAITVSGFKQEIDGQDWLVKEVTHTLNEGSGWTIKAQMERGAKTDHPI